MTDDVQGFLECPCYISYTQNADECLVRLGDIDLKVGFKGEIRRINVSDTWKRKSIIHLFMQYASYMKMIWGVYVKLGQLR